MLCSWDGCACTDAPSVMSQMDEVHFESFVEFLESGRMVSNLVRVAMLDRISVSLIPWWHRRRVSLVAGCWGVRVTQPPAKSPAKMASPPKTVDTQYVMHSAIELRFHARRDSVCCPSRRPRQKENAGPESSQLPPSVIPVSSISSGEPSKAAASSKATPTGQSLRDYEIFPRCYACWWRILAWVVVPG